MAEIEINGFYIVELMGHRKLAGKLTKCEVGDHVMLRIDIPNGDSFTTQLYSPSAVYGLTPTTEELARQFSRVAQPEPVHRWELKMLQAGTDVSEDDDDQF